MSLISPRPEHLNSHTIKIKPPTSEHAIYLTISYIENKGLKRPVEVFLNSKDLKNFQWISCIMRLLSAVLQQEGPFPWYALDEMMETFDPAGGYIVPKSRGKRVHGVVSHIGWILKKHCEDLGIPKPEKEDIKNE